MSAGDEVDELRQLNDLMSERYPGEELRDGDSERVVVDEARDVLQAALVAGPLGEDGSGMLIVEMALKDLTAGTHCVASCTAAGRAVNAHAVLAALAIQCQPHLLEVFESSALRSHVERVERGMCQVAEVEWEWRPEGGVDRARSSAR